MLPNKFSFTCNPLGVPFQAERTNKGDYLITREGRYITVYPVDRILTGMIYSQWEIVQND